MKKYLSLLVVLLTTLFSVNAMAWDPPPSPKPNGSIVDQAHAFTANEINRLNMQIRQVNLSTGNEIGVLVLPSLNGQDIRDVGFATARAWGVGKAGVDNGVMVIWSPGDRKIGIETGKGVEGDLPDLKCNDIIRNTIAPQFKSRNFFAGLSQGIAAIGSSITDRRAEIAQAKADKDRLAQTPPTPAANPQATTAAPQSGGCSTSGTASMHGGGVALLVLALVALAVLFLFIRSQTRQRIEEEVRLARLRSELEQRVRAKLAETAPVSLTTDNPQPFTGPLTVETSAPLTADPTYVAAVETAKELERLQQETARRARLEQERLANGRAAELRRLEAERRARERAEEEEAALASVAALAGVVAISTKDDGNDDEPEEEEDHSDDSSSSSNASCSSDSNDDDGFGGGDFGGGGSSDDY